MNKWVTQEKQRLRWHRKNFQKGKWTAVGETIEALLISHEMGNPGKACPDCGGTGKTEKNEDAVDENFTQAAAAAARAHKTEV